ncbi:glutaminyl-peptide cyclotransferase [uncultured Sphingomonas sp.]|uniref:glutaminyl-peptide cyclotransferase n=1 Tax=uncultured Sphingomonas sp. TaxID=158754 RepID=UPI00261DAA3F|nr:glutaminyl-peptide cyclotransferase [uncultured Sphingomonas sp.]
MRGLALALLLALAPVAVRAELPTVAAKVVRTYPHDPRAFTEGLFWHGGTLYESTGEPGRSFIRKVDLATGHVLAQATIAAPTFGEGIVPWHDQIVSLTWQDHKGWRWSLDGLKRLSEWHYPGEGWALTSDGHSLIMSDGTPALRFLDPDTLTERHRLTVTAEGKPVANLNELEWVDGEILANIWQTDFIARIDPKSGHVVGWIDVGALHRQIGYADSDAVPNGIAWDAAKRRLFVTGKDWPTLFEIVPPKRR